MHIQVTRDHIKAGIPRKVCHCALAKAIHSATGNCNWQVHTVEVRGQLTAQAYLPVGATEDGVSVTVNLPVACLDFITRFDAMLSPEPFTFEADFESVGKVVKA